MHTLFRAATIALLVFGLSAAVSAQDTAPPRPTSVGSSQILIQSGAVVLKVAHFDVARQQVLDNAEAQGALMMDARTLTDSKGREHGWVRFRIDAAHLPTFLSTVAGVGRLYGQKITTTNRLSKYDELARRVTSLRAHEQRLDGVLARPQHMRGSDILYLQERLFRANVDENMLLQQRADLEESARVSTIQIELFEPGTLPAEQQPQRVDLAHWFANSQAISRGVFSHQLARAATGCAYALTYAPLWLPVLIVVLLALHWLWVRRRVFAAWVIAWIRRGIAALRELWIWSEQHPWRSHRTQP